MTDLFGDDYNPVKPKPQAPAPLPPAEARRTKPCRYYNKECGYSKVACEFRTLYCDCGIWFFLHFHEKIKEL